MNKNDQKWELLTEALDLGKLSWTILQTRYNLKVFLWLYSYNRCSVLFDFLDSSAAPNSLI